MAFYRFICAPNMFHLFESALKYFIALHMSFWLKQFMEFILSFEINWHYESCECIVSQWCVSWLLQLMFQRNEVREDYRCHHSHSPRALSSFLMSARLCVYVCLCPFVFPAFDYGFLLRISEDAHRVEALNEYLSSRSYLAGYGPSQADAEAFALLCGPPPERHVHALRWYKHIAALKPQTNDQTPECSSE